VSYIPQDDKLRKGLPLWKFVTGYFPKAIREMCKVSVVNNVRYNPEREPTDINWARGKSADQLGSSFRHMMERTVDGKIFDIVPEDIAKQTGIERIYVLAENAWRACAELELEIEREEGKALQPKTSYDKEWADACAGVEKPYKRYIVEDPLPMPPVADSTAPRKPSEWERPFNPKVDKHSANCSCDRIFSVFDTCGWVDRQGRLHTIKGCEK
jgi:hypothetical protein